MRAALLLAGCRLDRCGVGHAVSRHCRAGCPPRFERNRRADSEQAGCARLVPASDSCLWENSVLIEKNIATIMDDNKRKALQAALSQIEKQFGKGSIMKLGEAEISQDIQVVSTGSLGLDIALGVGGLPRGRVVEIYGPESSGKTTLTLSVIAQMQKHGRHRRLHRRRARARSAVRPQARRERRRAAHLPARQRRAGARDRRHAGALRARWTSW